MRATLASVLALGALALAGVAWAKPGDQASRRSGRAVRVPRPSALVSTGAKFCALQEDDRGVCFAPVAVGDGGSVLSTDGSNWGQTEIVEVTPNLNRCGQPDSWAIRIDRGRLNTYYDYGATLVIGMNLSSEAQLLTASRAVPNENELASVMYVVDADGDGEPELLADQYGCDINRKASTEPTHQCYEYWVAIRDRWQRGRIDQIATCSR